MYANEADVRTLCINVRSELTLAFIEIHGATADAIIDGKIGDKYYWPTDANGNANNSPPPELIKQIANRLTAAYIERVKYAVNDANGQPMGSPYAASLERAAKELLSGVCEGDILIPTLQEVSPIRTSPGSSSFGVSGGPFSNHSNFGIGHSRRGGW